MTTSVRLPADLLRAVDRRARELGLSRNGYLVRALEHSLATDNGWSPDFVAMLEAVRTDTGRHDLIDEMTREITASRKRSGPPVP